MMKKTTYDIIYSIGYDCACALWLKKMGLRLTSGPLDWLTKASFEQRFDVLLNDFKDFLDPKDLKKIERTDNVHDRYKNIKTGFYFYHDFPVEVPFSEAIVNIKEKYNRRIERFYKNITEKENVLLVFFSQYTDTSNETIQKLCTKFCEKIRKKIDFLIIEHKEDCKEICKIQITNNIVKYNLNSIVFDNQQQPLLLGNVKKISKIFKQYQLPCRHRIKKIAYRTLAIIILPFVFNKRTKKKIKAVLRK